MFEISYLKLGQKGVINYDIPVYSIGHGKPEITITCSVHGDETAGLFIVNDFLKKIKNIKLNGKINIIPSANPVAQFLNSRTAFLDQKDLNRSGSGNPFGSYTDRLANLLFNFLIKSDIVINIHEFEMISPVMGIFDCLEDKEKEFENKILEVVKIFNPDIIWKIDYEKASDSQYQTTLDMALTKAGIINFPFETSQLSLITKENINKASEGLVNVVSHFNIIDKKPETAKKDIPVFVRKEFSSELAGLWEPSENLKLLEKVQKGDLIGKIVNLPDFSETEICAEDNGVLIQYRHRQIVGNGSSIYSIGQD